MKVSDLILHPRNQAHYYAQRAAIARNQEVSNVRRAGGGHAIAGVILDGNHSAPSATHLDRLDCSASDLDYCTLCKKRFSSHLQVLWENFGLAHEMCLLEKFGRYEYSPLIIAAEVAIRRRLATELQRTHCRRQENREEGRSC